MRFVWANLWIALLIGVSFLWIDQRSGNAVASSAIQPANLVAEDRSQHAGSPDPDATVPPASRSAFQIPSVRNLFLPARGLVTERNSPCHFTPQPAGDSRLCLSLLRLNCLSLT